MKLTLKDIACYLPYGLKMKDTLNDEAFTLDVENISGVVSDLELNTIKPCLRPLSSLCKPLKDGTYPIAVIGRMYEPNGKLYCEDGIYSYGWNTHVCDDYQGYEIGWIDSVGWFGIFYDEYDINNQGNNFTGDYIPFNREMLDHLYTNHFWLGDQSYFEKGIILNLEEIEE